jgi:hypothetical protein
MQYGQNRIDLRCVSIPPPPFTGIDLVKAG